jgi:hypothetical protein
MALKTSTFRTPTPVVSSLKPATVATGPDGNSMDIPVRSEITASDEVIRRGVWWEAEPHEHETELVAYMLFRRELYIRLNRSAVHFFALPR